MNKIAGILAAVAMVAIAPVARADYNISINGADCVGPTVSATPNVFAQCTPQTVSGVTITGLSTTGTQTSAFSEQLTATGSVENLTSSPVTLQIDAGISNYSSPTIPPATGITDASTITLNETLGQSTGLLTSCVDQSNGLVPPDSSFCSSPAPGMAGPNPSLTVTGSQGSNNTTFGTITALHASFSLTQELSLTLNPGTSLNFTLTQVLTPVPEPSAIVLLGTLLVGVATLFRKRLARQS